MDRILQKKMSALIEKYSVEDIRLALTSIEEAKDERVLTVVVNIGMHSLPEKILRGDVFFFSEGNVELGPESVTDTIKLLTKRALRFLRGKIWNKVYVIPSGHPLLVSMATLIIYRVTRVNPTIVYYVNGEYLEANLDVRLEAVKTNALK